MLKPQENVSEQGSFVGIRHLKGDGVDLTPAVRREHIQQWILRGGMTILEESDVIDMGDYVAPREVLGGTRYILNSDSLVHYAENYCLHEVFSDWSVSENIRSNSTIYLGEKPLRITGLFKYEVPYGTNLFVLRIMEGRQVEMSFLSGSADRPEVLHKGENNVFTPNGITRVDYQTLSAKDKKSIAVGTRNLMSREMVYKYSTLLQNLESNSRATKWAMIGNDAVYRDNAVHKWGGRIDAGRLRTIRREITKPLGEFLKRSINGDLSYEDVANDVVELLSSGRLGSNQIQHLVNTWNDICYHADEVTYGLCSHVFHHMDGHGVYGGDEHVCDDCFEDKYVWVEDRDEYWHQDDAYHHESNDTYYSYPEYDDDDDDDERSGLSSWGASTEYLKHDKSFKPSPTGDFTMGIELEVEATESRKKRVSECADYFNASYSYAMFKSDGSLDGQLGFEIVTAARRLGDHIKMFKDWQPEELTSWDAGNCGMHVHIDSRAFTPLTLGKFLMFFNSPDNAQFIRDIAGRHPTFDSQAQSYAATIDKSYVNNPERVKKSRYDNESRYRMVNVTNLTDSEQGRLGLYVERQSKGSYSTIEVRIFRGTLRKDRLLAQIEFAHAAVAFCRSASWQEMDGDAFKHWLSVTEGYPHLRRWYGVSRARNKNNTEAAQAAEVEEI